MEYPQRKKQIRLTVALAMCLALLPAIPARPTNPDRQQSDTAMYAASSRLLADSVINLKQWKFADGGNDHWYGILAVMHDWLEADSIAPSLTLDTMSGYLATIKNSAENDFIFDSILPGADPPSVGEQFLLGGSNLSGPWSWGTGENFCYTNWAVGEPNVLTNGAITIWGPAQSPPPTPSGSWNSVEHSDAADPFARFWAVVEWGDPDTSSTTVCGNGILECGEECDDSNLVAGDGCDPLCQFEGPVCGNGIVESGEQCDDGNTNNGDGCDATCQSANECPIVLTGDVNGNGSITSADVIYLVNAAFKRGPEPLPCRAAGDVNCSGNVTSADVIFLVNYIFKRGPGPCNACTSTAPC